MKTKTAFSTRGLTVTAILSVIAFVLMFLDFAIPSVIPSFVKMDVSDLPALLGAFALGPVSGVMVELLKNLLKLLIEGTDSGFIGELCNFLLGAAFVFVAGAFYHSHKTRKRALAASFLGAAIMALVSVPINYFLVYPVYATVYAPMDVIVGMYKSLLPCANTLLKCLLIFNMPFTFVKGVLDVLICWLIYKPLSPVLHGRSE